MSLQHSAAARARVTTPEEAEAMVSHALGSLDALEQVITQETSLLRDGQMREALKLSEQKTPVAQHYQRTLQDLKANAIALGRFAPPNLPALRQRHEAFAALMQLNMAVLGTAKTVSESIMRELATDAGLARSPQGYGTYGQPAGGYRTPVMPLAVSKTL